MPPQAASAGSSWRSVPFASQPSAFRARVSSGGRLTLRLPDGGRLVFEPGADPPGDDVRGGAGRVRRLQGQRQVQHRVRGAADLQRQLGPVV